MMDDGFLMTALWFLAGLFVLPWLLKYALSYVTPFIPISGAILVYSIIGLEALLALVSYKVHSGLAMGLGVAVALDILRMFVPLPF